MWFRYIAGISTVERLVFGKHSCWARAESQRFPLNPYLGQQPIAVSPALSMRWIFLSARFELEVALAASEAVPAGREIVQLGP